MVLSCMVEGPPVTGCACNNISVSQEYTPEGISSKPAYHALFLTVEWSHSTQVDLFWPKLSQRMCF